MGDETVLAPAPSLQLGVLAMREPGELIERASAIATELAQIIEKRHLYVKVKQKMHVYVEGWTTLGAMLGVLPREVSVEADEEGNHTATVELIRVNDGAIIGRASASCGMDEAIWAKRETYARRSMAITRATGKAFRLAFSWIMTLGGYEATPAEEMSQAPAKAIEEQIAHLEALDADARELRDPEFAVLAWLQKAGLKIPEIQRLTYDQAETAITKLTEALGPLRPGVDALKDTDPFKDE